MIWLVVALGGALGCLLRYGISEKVYEWCGTAFPYGILTVNILGSALIGFFAILLVNKLHAPELWRAAIVIGFLGGFTTFSSFSLDTLQLLQQGLVFKAFSYVLISVIVCVLATWGGVALANSIS